ncbi:acyl-CoA synthase [Nocardia vaccinii]|uniref:acyl-CoA synthase n=1 Tax=Nocardia vaccinii TaxID=1822 RepID=UPI000A9DA535|nr:acyl-CoA synthase [Nocardia vaccinii]
MNNVDESSLERPDEDDYDLLTQGEARVRLAEEVVLTRKNLAELDADSDDARQLRQRITDLETTAARYRNIPPTRDPSFFSEIPRTGASQ